MRPKKTVAERAPERLISKESAATIISRLRPIDRAVGAEAFLAKFPYAKRVSEVRESDEVTALAYAEYLATPPGTESIPDWVGRASDAMVLLVERDAELNRTIADIEARLISRGLCFYANVNIKPGVDLRWSNGAKEDWAFRITEDGGETTQRLRDTDYEVRCEAAHHLGTLVQALLERVCAAVTAAESAVAVAKDVGNAVGAYPSPFTMTEEKE